MITLEEFKIAILNLKKFEDEVNNLCKTFTGKSYGYYFETEWYIAATNLFDVLIKSHFSEVGCDLINAFLYDDIKGNWGITLYTDKDLFNEGTKIEITTIEDLYNYLLSDKVYLK
jgi:hypothetical protein